MPSGGLAITCPNNTTVTLNMELVNIPGLPYKVKCCAIPDSTNLYFYYFERSGGCWGMVGKDIGSGSSMRDLILDKQLYETWVAADAAQAALSAQGIIQMYSYATVYGDFIGLPDGFSCLGKKFYFRGNIYGKSYTVNIKDL